MLHCDDTAFRRPWRAKLGKSATIPAMAANPKMDTDELARRFFALWGEYLTALAGDPQTLDVFRRWLGPAAAGEAAGSGPPPRAAAASAASGERDGAMAELARRVDELERRLAALEPRKPGKRTAAGVHRRTRAARAGKA